MSSQALGFGIIGCGMVAEYHARAIRHARGARLVGAMSRTSEKARRFSRKHGLDFSTSRLEELLARPDIHVVCITTPSGAHLGPALAAIRAGKHLIVEKPIEITVERVDEMLGEARKAGVQVGAVFQARFGAGARKVKDAIEAGRFGRLVLCSAYVKWQRTAEYYRDNWHGTLALDGGGALMNQGIHAVDLLQWFAGMPSEVFGWRNRCVHTGIEAEDAAVASVRFAHGALGTIEASTAIFPGFSRRIEICGEHGSAVLEEDRITTWKFRESRPEDESILSAGTENSLGSGASRPDQISFQGHLAQIQDFIDALNEGRAPAVSGQEARNAVSIIRAIYISAERGLPVKL